MLADPDTADATVAAPAYVIPYTYSFEDALDAGRFFQERVYRWYVGVLSVGVLAGVIFTISGASFVLPITLFCAAMLLMARFSVMDRLVSGRRLRSLIGRGMELVLNHDGIAWTGPLSTGQIPWASVTEVRANNKSVLFVSDRLLLAYAPANAFATSDAQAAVVAYARREVDAARTDPDPATSR